MKRLRRSLFPALLACCAVALGACGEDEEPLPTDQGVSELTTTPAPATDAQTTASGEEASTTVYLLHEEKLVPLRRTVQSGQQIGTATLKALLAGPTAAEARRGITTAVPEGTKLNGLVIEDGTATADFSQEFASGGGSLSMQARAAQVTYALTRFPTVQQVEFELDGEPVETLGGEGLDVAGGVDRADFEDVTPQILIESPLSGDRVASPLRLFGTSNNFEATFIVELRGGDGVQLAKETVTATSGSGQRGTFSVTLEFEAPAGAVELVAYEQSAENGRPIHVERVPLLTGG